MILTLKADLENSIFMPENAVSRTIRISGSCTLDELCQEMMNSINFDMDHVYCFYMGESTYSKPVYSSMPNDRDEKSTKEKLYSLRLSKGQVFTLLYDFGDEWIFRFKVLEISDAPGNIKTEVIERIGEAEQYPDWDDADIDADWDDEAFDEENDANGSKASSRRLSKGSQVEELLERSFHLSFDDDDFSEEYYEDPTITEDYNSRLGRFMLRVVERQLGMQEPRFVSDAYHALQRKGYVRKEAKTIIATCLSAEVFEIVKYGRKHSEQRYQQTLQEAVDAPFDMNRVLDLPTGREHRIQKLLEEFEDYMMENEDVSAAKCFAEAWPLLRKCVEDNFTRETENGLERYSLSWIDQHTDHRMMLFNNVGDAAYAFQNARRYEEGLEIFSQILETFSWKDGSDGEIRGAIAECYEGLGKQEETDQYIQEWYRDSPGDPDATNCYVLILQHRGEEGKAQELLESVLPEKGKEVIAPRYINLYTRAYDFYRKHGDQHKAGYYKKLMYQVQGQEFEGESLSGLFGNAKEILSDGFPISKNANSLRNNGSFSSQLTSTKIYPNDPCPCGSGKKYKKCCGRK